MELAFWTQAGLILVQFLLISSLPREYTVINEACPGAEWNIMCRECCEYDQIECVCPGKKEVVGYTIPCCRNEENECDSCLIHPGCTIFENCKSCRNGSWGGSLDDFYVKGFYCAECRGGWYGGDCMRCGQVLRVPKGQILLESYPLNAHCEWTIHAKPGFIIQLRFVMLSLEFDYMCQYDYVEVRDGDNSDSRIIKRFCGNERPAPIQSTGSSLHILFQSDGSKNFDGFHAIFEEITACSSSPCFHDGTCLLDNAGSYRCACLAGYTGKHCESLLEEKNCSDPGGPVNGYRRTSEGRGLINGRYAKIGTIMSFFCNHSYVLSGNEQRTCQPNGEWSGKQPICIKAYLDDAYCVYRKKAWPFGSQKHGQIPPPIIPVMQPWASINFSGVVSSSIKWDNNSTYFMVVGLEGVTIREYMSSDLQTFKCYENVNIYHLTVI